MKTVKIIFLLIFVLTSFQSEAGWIKNLWNKTFNRKNKIEKQKDPGPVKDEYTIPSKKPSKPVPAK